ncbi:hypothetical protein THTE_0098 [Thermogutta terrifontis]|uniref:Uncharacterized protein n=1 Tax=Thermogutta terrifontis TaxID=1331910 RepID=A0A286R9S8_9BACT|nr:hypothetical protein THTE_0098 [Thermogutta terrifontis]
MELKRENNRVCGNNRRSTEKPIVHLHHSLFAIRYSPKQMEPSWD